VARFELPGQPAIPGKSPLGVMTEANSYSNDSLEAQRVSAERLSRHLSGEILELFSTAGRASSFTAGSLLIIEGSAASLIHVLIAGRARLSTHLDDGRRLILRIALPGEMFGLGTAFSDLPYEITAEAVTACLTISVTRQDFVHFLAAHSQACLGVCEMLSKHYRTALEEARMLAR